MGAAWRHVLMRLGKCVVSLPPLGRLQKKKKSERGSRVMFFFFGTAQPLLWLFHLLGDSLSFGLSLPLCRRARWCTEETGSSIDQSNTYVNTQTQLLTVFAPQLGCKKKKKKRKKVPIQRSNASSPLSLPSLLLVLHLLSPQEAWGECGPSLISPPPV